MRANTLVHSAGIVSQSGTASPDDPVELTISLGEEAAAECFLLILRYVFDGPGTVNLTFTDNKGTAGDPVDVFAGEPSDQKYAMIQVPPWFTEVTISGPTAESVYYTVLGVGVQAVPAVFLGSRFVFDGTGLQPVSS